MNALRSQDLVFTLYGDYLLGRERGVWVGSLITLLGRLGVSPVAARVVLSRMTQKGWLSAERRGIRSYYGLTRRGRRLLETGRERIYHPPRNEPWDGAWYLVAYSIPETGRRRRDALRVKLQWLGCGLLTNGLWITPHDVRNELRETAEALKVSKHLEVFRGDHLGYSSTAQLVAACWDLQAINRRYAAFLDRWRPALGHCAECRQIGGACPAIGEPGHPCAAPEDCFVRRFQLVHEYRTFPQEDPFLPAPLLPEDWKGDEAARLFEACHAVLAVPAERYVQQVCEAGETVQAAPAA
ncbi:MAG TPA: PaaX family transcriptional regulator C-terminal domain-containing protein [Vicinamibacterales bacterium]|nr:PaaX family transcriptional regulator C-terminal domain-containing protein [Vicinamibacterales bacterium]